MTLSQLITELYDIHAVKFGEFTLKSGIKSPIYIDLRQIVSAPKILSALADQMWDIVPKDSDRICGVPYTALPIATCIAIKHNIPMLMLRKEAKQGYGTAKRLEGIFQPGQRCLIFEDVITSGGSVIESVTALRDAGLDVTDVVVFVDRNQGGKQALQQHGLNVHTVTTLNQLFNTLQQQGKLSDSEKNLDLSSLEKI